MTVEGVDGLWFYLSLFFAGSASQCLLEKGSEREPLVQRPPHSGTLGVLGKYNLRILNVLEVFYFHCPKTFIQVTLCICVWVNNTN